MYSQKVRRGKDIHNHSMYSSACLITESMCRGTEYAIPKCGTLACIIHCLELKTINTQHTQEFSNCPLTEVKNLDRKRAIANDNFLYQKDFSIWHGKHLFTKYLLYSFSCELSSSPLKPQTPSLYSGWYINLNCLTAFVCHIFEGT